MSKNKYTLLPIPDDTAWSRKGSIWLRFKRLFWKIFDKKGKKFDRFVTEKIFIPIDNFFDGIKNYINWSKVIWTDRNWDWRYIYEIIEKKLELQRKELITANRHQGIEETNAKFTLILNLIDKVKDEYYSCEYFDYQKSGDWVFTPTGESIFNEFSGEYEETSTLDIPLIWEKYDDYLNKYKSSVRYIKKNVNPDYWKDKKGLVIRVAKHNENKARALLFKLLERNINSFWD